MLESIQVREIKHVPQEYDPVSDQRCFCLKLLGIGGGRPSSANQGIRKQDEHISSPLNDNLLSSNSNNTKNKNNVTNNSINQEIPPIHQWKYIMIDELVKF